jgi:hypothetical protein
MFTYQVSASRAKYQSLMAELMQLRAALAAANERMASLEAEMIEAAAAAALSIEERDVTISGESHDQADAEWIVIRTQLRGHNDMLFGRPAPGRSSGRPGSGRPSGVFCMF